MPTKLSWLASFWKLFNFRHEDGSMSRVQTQVALSTLLISEWNNLLRELLFKWVFEGWRDSDLQHDHTATGT